jgi:hypothetical protein
MWHNDTGEAIWRTSDGALVSSDDPGAAFLVVGIDGSIPLSDAETYGLIGANLKAKKEAPEDKAKAPPPPNKAKT